MSLAVAHRETHHEGVRAAALVVMHVLLATAMRLLVTLRYRIDSDEPQHLHVVWEWSRGLVAYRDFYDNHLPLFHVLFAPLMAMTGESERVLLLARLAMLPIAAASIALTWWIANRLYGRSTAFWCALATSVMPVFLLKSVEFRNDVLWTAGALAAVAIAIGPPTVRRFAALGLVLGLTLLVSIKTVHVAAGLGAALLLVHGRRLRPAAILALAAGCAAAPLLAGTWFWSQGALDDLWRCAIELNGKLDVATWRRVVGVSVLAVAAALSVWMSRRMHADRALVAVTAALFIGSVSAVSPLISPRDFLAVIPLLMLFLTARAEPLFGTAMHFVPPALVVLTAIEGRLLEPPPAYDHRVISQTLDLTLPGEPVLDIKGETIFRPRATYVAYERVGREMVSRGIIEDTLTRDLIASRCYVATRDSDFFPRQARRFLHEHYVPYGNVRVAGQRVRSDGTFTIAIPGEYVVLDERGRMRAGPLAYRAGRHRLPSELTRQGAVVIWAGVTRLRDAP